MVEEEIAFGVGLCSLEYLAIERQQGDGGLRDTLVCVSVGDDAALYQFCCFCGMFVTRFAVSAEVSKAVHACVSISKS